MSDSHWNQAGGPDLAASHPSIRGRERELRALADGVRRLIAATVRHTADVAETADLARRVHALADELEARVPATPVARYTESRGDWHPHDTFAYDVMLGLYNPLALPIEVAWQPPRAIGEARFTTAYEGPPGCVHGAVLAGAFDQVFNVANLGSGTAGPTRELTLRYRRPTPLDQPLRFEAWIEASDDRSVTTIGHVLHRGQVTVEGRGHFARLTRERIATLARETDEPTG